MKIIIVVPENIYPEKNRLDILGPFNTLFKHAHIEYALCLFKKKCILEKIRKKCHFILLLVTPCVRNACTFMGVSHNDIEANNNIVSRMFEDLLEIEKNIPMYPPIAFIQCIVSKTLMTKIPRKICHPCVKRFLYYKTSIVDNMNEAVSYFVKNNVDKVSITLGYDTAFHVYHVNDWISLDIQESILNQLEMYRKGCGFAFIISIEPYQPILEKNSEIMDNMNEYKCLFVNGILCPIATFSPSKSFNGLIIHPSIELDPIRNIDHANIITVAKYAQKSIYKYINMNPIHLQIHVSCTILPDKTKRYYVSNISLDNLHVRIPYQPSDAARVNRISNINQCTITTCLPYPEDISSRLVTSYIEYIYSKIDEE